MWTTKYDLLASGEMAVQPGAAEGRQDGLAPITLIGRSARPAIARAARAVRGFGRVWLDAQARAAGLLWDER